MQSPGHIIVRSDSVASKHTTRTAHVRKHAHTVVRTTISFERWKRNRISCSNISEIYKISWKGACVNLNVQNEFVLTCFNFYGVSPLISLLCLFIYFSSYFFISRLWLFSFSFFSFFYLHILLITITFHQPTSTLLSLLTLKITDISLFS